MTCSVSKLPGLSRTPTAEWLKVTVGEDRNNLNRSTLNFSPLRTSDAGRYRCQGSLTTNVRPQPLSDRRNFDLIAQSKSKISIATCLYIAINNCLFPVPKPAVRILRFPSDSTLFANLSEVVFTCQVSIHTNIDTPVNLSLTWTREVYDNKDDTIIEVITMNSTTSTVERSWTFTDLSSKDQRLTCNGGIRSASSYIQDNSRFHVHTLSVAGKLTSS